MPGDPWSLPSPREKVAAFLTAVSTDSKAARVSQRHSQGHRGHRHSWSHKLPQTSCCLQQHLHTAPINHKPASQLPCFSSAGRDKRSVVPADTQHPLDPHTHTHTFSIPSGTCTAPRPSTCQLLQLDAHWQTHRLTHSSLMHFTFSSLPGCTSTDLLPT